MVMIFIPNISVSANVTFAGGDGSVENPFQVSTPEQLNEVRYHLGAHFIQINDIDMSAATTAGGIFYNNGEGWEPIGSSFFGNVFSGVYNGNGHRIIGLQMDRHGNVETLQSSFGLFGYNSGINKNLGLADGNIRASSERRGINVGGIVGHNEGLIRNCFNTSDVSAHNPNIPQPVTHVGGIVGMNRGIIRNCYIRGIFRCLRHIHQEIFPAALSDLTIR